MEHIHRPLRRSGSVLSAGAVLVTSVLLAPASAVQASAVRDVSYRGYHLSVPADWTVVDLAAQPGACVRFDRRAVYLGRPAADQRCPAGIRGRAEAVLVQPLDAAAVSGARDIRALGPRQGAPTTVSAGAGGEVSVAVPAAGVLVTGVYGAGPGAVPAVLRSGRLDDTARPSAMPPVRAGGADAGGASAAIPAGATDYTGYGFDACTAPSSSAMTAWLDSSFRAVGVYFGGRNRACAQPNLTASWLTTQADKGWHFIPIYVGTQAGGLGSDPAGRGTTEADDAVDAATRLGIAPGSVLYNDMEAYSATHTAKVLSYLDAWTARLRARGYRSGVYSSSASGVKDLNAHYGPASPDVIYFANWNGVANTNDPFVSAGHWANHQRIHQYRGPHNETHGGVTINIDSDYLDVAATGEPQPPTPPAWPLVRQGAAGERVKTIQHLLNHGGATLTVDGAFGQLTTTAVRSFQAAHGLAVDGVVGPDTWAALAVTVTTGSGQHAVRAVQGQLSAHGLPTTVDGVFGPATAANVRSYQQSIGMTPTGVVDRDTWRFLVG